MARTFHVLKIFAEANKLFTREDEPSLAPLTDAQLDKHVALGNIQEYGLVAAPPVDLSLGAKVEVGETIPLGKMVHDAGGAKVAGGITLWSSSNPAVATVDADGNVTGVSEGEAQILAKSYGFTSKVYLQVGAGLVAVAPVTPEQAAALSLLWDLPNDRMRPRVHLPHIPPQFWRWPGTPVDGGRQFNHRWTISRSERKWRRVGSDWWYVTPFQGTVGVFRGAAATSPASLADKPWQYGGAMGSVGVETAVITFPVYDVNNINERLGSNTTRWVGPAIQVDTAFPAEVVERAEYVYARVWFKADNAGNAGKKITVSIFTGNQDDNTDKVLGEAELVMPAWDPANYKGWGFVDIGPMAYDDPHLSLNPPLSVMYWGNQNAQRVTAMRTTCMFWVGSAARPDELDGPVPIHDQYGYQASPGSRNFARTGGSPVANGEFDDLGDRVTVFRPGNYGDYAPRSGVPAPDFDAFAMNNRYMTAVELEAGGASYFGSEADNIRPIIAADWLERHENAPTTPDNSMPYVWVSFYAEADDSGWLPADDELVATVYNIPKYPGDHTAPLKWTPFRAHCCLDHKGNVDGGRIYAARVLIGRDAYTADYADVRFKVTNPTGVTRTFLVYALGFEPEAWQSSRDMGYLPEVIPAPSHQLGMTQAQEKATGHGKRGLGKGGPLMLSLPDVSQYLTTVGGFLAEQIAIPVDPVALWNKQVADGISGLPDNMFPVMLAWHDAGVTGSPAYMLYLYITTQQKRNPGDALQTPQLQVRLVNNTAGVDPTVATDGDYADSTASIWLDAVGMIPAWSEIRVAVRWLDCMIVDVYLQSPGMNGGVGQWFLPDGTVSPGLGEPVHPARNGRVWDWTDQVKVQTYWAANQWPMKFYIGSERDVDIHFKGSIRHMALSRLFKDRAFVQDLMGQHFKSRMNWLTNTPL